MRAGFQFAYRQWHNGKCVPCIREVETFGKSFLLTLFREGAARAAARPHRRRKGARDPRMTSTKRPRDDPFDSRSRDARPRGADAERSFECRVCRARHRFDYFGRRPPWCATVTFLEEAYVMRDPFVAPPRDRKSARSPLCLGAPCRLCGRAVCSLPSCSLFYAVRMCRTCLTPAVVRQLPAQVQAIIKRDMAASRAARDEGESQQHASQSRETRDRGKPASPSPPPLPPEAPDRGCDVDSPRPPPAPASFAEAARRRAERFGTAAPPIARRSTT